MSLAKLGDENTNFQYVGKYGRAKVFSGFEFITLCRYLPMV